MVQFYNIDTKLMFHNGKKNEKEFKSYVKSFKKATLKFTFAFFHFSFPVPDYFSAFLFVKLNVEQKFKQFH